MKYPKQHKYVLLAHLPWARPAGQGVVWYTGQFLRALSSSPSTLKLDYVSAYSLIGLSLLLGTPFFIFFFGWLSDRIGRLKIILAGCLIAAVTYFPAVRGFSRTNVESDPRSSFAEKNPISVAGEPGGLQVPHFPSGRGANSSPIATG